MIFVEKSMQAKLCRSKKAQRLFRYVDRERFFTRRPDRKRKLFSRWKEQTLTEKKREREWRRKKNFGKIVLNLTTNRKEMRKHDFIDEMKVSPPKTSTGTEAGASKPSNISEKPTKTKTRKVGGLKDMFDDDFNEMNRTAAKGDKERNVIRKKKRGWRRENLKPIKSSWGGRGSKEVRKESIPWKCTSKQWSWWWKP